MPDLQKINEIKEKMLNYVTNNGPSLPIQLNKEAQIDSLFGSAFLAELIAEGRIKISYMKVGSSPIYYLLGQEPHLEKFVEYLNHKEKEAFHLLKKEKLLDDEKQHPAIRVALRAIKDFAIPLRIRINAEEKNFWKYYLLSETEMQEKINSITPKEKKKENTIEIFNEENIETKQQTIETESKVETKTNDVLEQEEKLEKEREVKLKEFEEIPEIKEEIDNEIQEITTRKPKQKQEIERPKVELSLSFEKRAPKPEKIIPEFPFVKQVKSYLERKEINLIQIIQETKKDFIAKVSIETQIGHQHYFLIAKDKKRVKTEELIDALKEAHSEKMPCLFLAPGDLEKKAQLSLEEWKGLVKFEKIH